MRFFLLNFPFANRMESGEKTITGVFTMKTWGKLREFFMITLGTMIAAAGVFFFMIPSHVTMGSVSGLAVVLAEFIPLKISVVTFILNAVLLVIGFVFIGKDFGVKTVYTSLLVPVMLGVFEILFPENKSLTEDAFLDVLCYIFVVGIGQAILFNWNASSGGLDILGKLLNKFLHMELGKAISMCGMGVALLSVFVSDKKIVVLSILGTYLSGIVLDHFIFGFNEKKRVCILSQKEEEMKEFILHKLHSGATIYEAHGAYDDQVRREIITIVNKTEYSQLMNFIAKTDKDAFVTVYAVNEVLYKPKI